MNKSILVIKGAFYYDNDSDTILMPHYTGEFSVVDCDEYIKMEELKERYYESYIENNKNDFINYKGQKYYFAEYSPRSVTDEWDLLSDLSELSHFEEDYDF